MDLTELITAAPNLAFGLACLWYVQQVQKERVVELARYATSLEKINELYIQLLEKAVTAIANNASQSTNNGDVLAKLLEEFAAIRRDIGGLRDGIDRVIRDSAKRHTGDRRAAQGGTGTD